MREALLESVARGRERHALTRNLVLPPIIASPGEVFAFHIPPSQPNFITRKSVTAPVASIDDPPESFTGRILFVPSADPGFDWIFTRGISGFVTQFGGANSAHGDPCRRAWHTRRHRCRRRSVRALAVGAQAVPRLHEPEGPGHRMKAVAITQRVSVVPAYGERRDCLDQAWTRFLTACGLLPLLLPNATEAALALCEGADITGLVFTGGNDLATLGGDAPERDAVENAMLDLAVRRRLPILAFVAACK